MTNRYRNYMMIAGVVLLLTLLLLWQCRQPDQQPAPPSDNTPAVGQATTPPSNSTVTADSQVIIDPTATTAVVTTTTTPLTSTTPLTPPLYLAERITLQPIEVPIDLTGVYTWSDKPNLHFENWSNSGQQLMFSVLFLHRGRPGYRPTDNWTVGLDGQNPQRVITHSSRAKTWSPDDTKIAYHLRTDVFTEEMWWVDLSILTHTQLEPPIVVDDEEEIHYNEPFWLDNQRLLYQTFTNSQQQVWVHNVISNEVSEVIWNNFIKPTTYYISLAPNRTTVIINAVNEGVLLGELVNVGSDYHLNILETLQDRYIGRSVFWAPDSRQAAFIAYGDDLDYGLRIWDVVSRQKRDWYGPRSYIIDVTWSPDSQTVVTTFDPPTPLDGFSSEDDFTRYAEMRNLDGSSGVFLNNYDASATAWSSDGRYLTFITSSGNRNDSNLFDVFEVEVK